MIEIKLTESEMKTLNSYLEKALVDAKGMQAIGIGSKMSVNNLESISKKIKEQQNNLGMRINNTSNKMNPNSLSLDDNEYENWR